MFLHFQGFCDNSKGLPHVLLSISSTRFPLPSSQCSSVQRSSPTGQRTDCVQHIQGGRSASSHPCIRRVSLLSCSCLIAPPSSLPFSLSLIQRQLLETQHRVGGEVHVSLPSQQQHTPPLPQHAESTYGHAPRHVPLHELMGNDCQFGLVLWCH